MAYMLDILPFLLEGLKVTLTIMGVTLLLSIPLGFLLAFIRHSGLKILIFLIDGYTWLFRGTPLLLQLFFFMYGLPFFGIVLSRETAAYLTFVLNYGAYFTEIFRGGIESIDKGQFEAAKVLNIPRFVQIRKIYVPQVFKRTLPTVANETITLLKDTALVSTIALGEMLRNAREVVARDLTAEPFLLAGVIYLMITFVLVMTFKKIEKKVGVFN